MFSRQELLESLAVSTKPVKLFAFGSSEFTRIPVEIARDLAATGNYEGGGSCRRCRYLRPTGPVTLAAANAIWQACYRTIEAAVLPPSAEVLMRQRHIAGRVVA